MNVRRICFLIALFTGIAFAVVHLRVEQTRCAARILRSESRWMGLRREWWALQTRAARFRAPTRIHERIDFLRTELVPPEVETMTAPAVRLASDRPQE